MLKLICLIMQQRQISKIFHSNLASLKPEIDELDIDKLIPDPVDLSKQCCKNDDVKKAVYNKLVEEVNNIDTSRGQILMINLKAKIKKSIQIKQSIYLLKMNLKS